ncbi:MAG: alkaline phosphatase [Bacteroidales bacterium]|nr:alkaline phosphatase [Bacteroidales bacterium]MCF8338794.1 alkaline phosphatase [Bacteroidales bacterium]
MKRLSVFILLFFTAVLMPMGTLAQNTPENIILFISDGWGKNHIEATGYYHHGETKVQSYRDFDIQYYVSTYPALDGKVWQSGNINKYTTGYCSDSAWTSPQYLRKHTTGSAASATAMASGFKTAKNAIGADIDSSDLYTIIDRANALNKSTGLVTSVPVSHATPAAFAAHNADRYNYAAIANEMIIDSELQVLMGCGHPYYTDDGNHSDTVVWNQGREYLGGMGTWNNLKAGNTVFDSTTVNGNQVLQDVDGDGQPDAWTLLHDSSAFVDLASGSTPKRVLGVPKTATTLQQYREYPGDVDSAAPYEVPFLENVPTLSDMTRAALNVLDDNEQGSFLMVEGGAVDWAAHSNQMDRLIEEQHDFDEAVDAAIEWVEENNSWEETLIIVTGDHECGFLTGPDYPGDDPVDNFGVVNNGLHNVPGHKWNDYRHTNQLVPLFAKGAGGERIVSYADEEDYVRGRFLNNTEIADVMFDLWPAPQQNSPDPKNVVILNGGGMGKNHMKTAEYYFGQSPPYRDWPLAKAMSTWPAMSAPVWENEAAESYDTWYNSAEAWTTTEFVRNAPTGSAAAATAMFSGIKTARDAVNVSIDSTALLSIARRAFETGKSTGVVTSIPVSSATPAALAAHNVDRNHYSQLANELIIDSKLSVMMGCGHPYYTDNGTHTTNPVWEDGQEYLGGIGTWENLQESAVTFDSVTINGNSTVQDIDGDGLADSWTMINDSSEFADMADGQTPVRVMGIPKVATTLQQQRSGSSRNRAGQPYQKELNTGIPTLADMTGAALNVLDNNRNGFLLTVEGGAIGWAAKEHQKGRLIEEQDDFNEAINTVIEWVEQESNWNETLVIVTGNHETGYLVGPDYGQEGDLIDTYPITDQGTFNIPGMKFLSDSNTNRLVPFFSKGEGSRLFNDYADELDFIRGRYLNNTEIAQGIFRMWRNKPDASPDIDDEEVLNTVRPSPHNTFQIYPNPADNVITLSLPGKDKAYTKLKIHDAKGKTVFSLGKHKAGNRFDVSDLSSGIYFVRVIFDQKILKQKLIVK